MACNKSCSHEEIKVRYAAEGEGEVNTATTAETPKTCCYGYKPLGNRVLLEGKITATPLTYAIKSAKKGGGTDQYTVLRIGDLVDPNMLQPGDHVHLHAESSNTVLVTNYICEKYKEGKPDIEMVVRSVQDANKNKIDLPDLIDSYVWFTLPIFDILGVVK